MYDCTLQQSPTDFIPPKPRVLSLHFEDLLVHNSTNITVNPTTKDYKTRQKDWKAKPDLSGVVTTPTFVYFTPTQQQHFSTRYVLVILA
jgi:hypothetical protein